MIDLILAVSLGVPAGTSLQSLAIANASHPQSLKKLTSMKNLAKVEFSEVKAGDAGPTVFKARQLFLDGRPVGWIIVHWHTEQPIVYWLSDHEIAYNACEFRKDTKDEVDPGCEVWSVLNLRDRVIEKLTLPGFDHFSSIPGVRKPFIAYGTVSQGGLVGCAVYDWQQKLLVEETRKRGQSPDKKKGSVTVFDWFPRAAAWK